METSTYLAHLITAVWVMGHSEPNIVTVAWGEVNSIDTFNYLFAKP